jgi:hypothetical protein
MKPRRLHHINKIHDGYVVRIRREGVQRYAFRTTLKAALAVRDAFLAGLPVECPPQSFSTKAHSNTGHVGICETHHRSRHKKYPCFAVSWAPARREQRTRFFHFDNPRTRAKALREAIAFRSAMVEERLRRDRAEQESVRRQARAL